MLGLASNLASASTHEQMYSLDLDGTGDYLGTGNAFQSTHRGSFSYSFWMKPDDGQPGAAENLLGCDNNADEDAFFITLDTAGKIKIDHEANNYPASYITNAAVYANGAGGWKHICVTVTKATNTSYIIYIDGAAVAGSLTDAVAEDEHAAWTSTDAIYIGATNDDGTALNPFTGKMDEVAIWNVALDADAVAAIYNSGKPFNLNYDRGNYDNSSALQGYWRMGNGAFDDKVNGAVHDQTNPGYGAEIVTNSTFDSDLTGWTLSGLDTENTITASGGKVVMSTDGNDGSGGPLLLQQTNVLVAGKTYKIEVDAYNISGAGFKIQDSAHEDVGLVLTDGHHTFFHKAVNTPLNIYRRLGGSASSGELDNISVQQLNGNPGLTSAAAMFSADTPDD